MSLISMRCPLNTLIGYGHAAWGILQELHKRGEIVDLYPIGHPYLSSGDPKIVRVCAERTYNAEAPSLTVWHEFDLIPNLIGKGKHVGLPFFEVNKMDGLRTKHLNACDHILVASHWAKQVLEDNRIAPPISVAPLGVDSLIFFPEESQEKKYRFFNIGKIENRKGTYLLPKAFRRAFPNEQDVELYMFPDSPLPQIKEELKQFIEESKAKLSDPRINFVSGSFEKDIDFADFIRKMDCGVYPTKAEGFGLPLLQTLSCGKPLITTNYSAHTEFCNEENSHLIQVTDFEPADDGKWFHGLGEWAKIDEDQLVYLMRTCYNERKRYNQAGIDTAREFSWANCVDKVKGALVG